MHDGTPPQDGLVRDWITVWQSELSAAAADREVQETWQAMASLWAGAAATMLGLPQGGPDGGMHSFGAPPRHPGAAAASRSATTAAAPDPRDAEIDRLGGRVADLERRLAELKR